MKLGNTRVISFINLKGGVGKTTTAVNVAATLGHSFYVQSKSERPRQAKVLLIDLDPQSNASLTLLHEKDYDPDKTIVNLFRHELNRDDQDDCFDLNGILYKSPVPGLNLDLIPSGLDLFDIQDELVKYHRYYLSATDILFNALNKLRESQDKAYTHIIIDCPPSLGLVTLNGLSLSNFYIVPVFLDAYSHWGLDKIIERVDTLKRCKASCETELLGIIYSKVDNQSSVQNREWKNEFSRWESKNKRKFSKLFKSKSGRIVFHTEIPKADIVRKAEAAHSPLVTFRPTKTSDKDSRDEHQKKWHSLVEEVIERTGLFKKT